MQITRSDVMLMILKRAFTCVNLLYIYVFVVLQGNKGTSLSRFPLLESIPGTVDLTSNAPNTVVNYQACTGGLKDKYESDAVSAGDCENGTILFGCIVASLSVWVILVSLF